VSSLERVRLQGLMVFNPSSMVNTAPHFGHFTFVSLLTIPAQPKENAAKTANAKTMLNSFFTPLHLLSLDRYLSILQICNEELTVLRRLWKKMTKDRLRGPLLYYYKIT
jgi:hypothetical protein